MGGGNLKVKLNDQAREIVVHNFQTESYYSIANQYGEIFSRESKIRKMLQV